MLIANSRQYTAEIQIMKTPVNEGKAANLFPILIQVSLLFSLALLMKALYSLPLEDSFLWYAGVFVYFYIPGSLLLRWLHPDGDEYFRRLFLSLGLGTALMPILYTILRRISVPELLYPSGFGFLILWSILTIGDIRKERIHFLALGKEIPSVIFLFAFIFLLLHFSHFTSVVLLKDGYSFSVDRFTDTAFHLGIINNLKNFYPPLFPYASGYDFSHYHLNMHLEIEMFNRVFSLDTLKLAFFYFPLLYFCLLVFIPYVFIREHLAGSRLIALLTGILLFGSDLSFIPGMLGMLPKDYPWTIVFNTTIWSLFTLNGYLPSLFVLFLSLVYLKEYHEKGSLRSLFIFALLGYAAYGFKSSMGPHIMGAALLAGIASVLLKGDRKQGLLQCAASAAAFLTMVADLLLLRGETGGDVIVLKLFYGLQLSLGNLGLPQISWFFYPVLFPIYLLASFGVRALGFYSFRHIFAEEMPDPTILFLTAFALSGFLLSETIYIGPLSGDINKAYWFSSQSLMGAWLLLPYFLLGLKDYRKRFASFLITALLFAVPTTVQFLNLRSEKHYFTVDRYATDVLKYLETTPPKSVILHPPNYQWPSLASNFAGRVSVIGIFRSFTPDWIGAAEEKRRLNEVSEFFNPAGSADRTYILKKYRVDYVYAPIIYATVIDREKILIEVYRNEAYAVYKVVTDSGW